MNPMLSRRGNQAWRFAPRAPVEGASRRSAYSAAPGGPAALPKKDRDMDRGSRRGNEVEALECACWGPPPCVGGNRSEEGGPVAQPKRRLSVGFWASMIFGMVLRLQAATIDSGSLSVGIPVPDGDASGLVRSFHAASTEFVVSVTVSVSLVGNSGFNGDLYASLVHGDRSAVLLNRVGLTPTTASGYGDSGMSIQFSDTAEAGDVHAYRMSLFGNHSTPLGGALTGSWAPSGRALDPAAVTESTARTALLSGFQGQVASGDWSLFVADMVGGNSLVLQDWSVQIETTPVPEPWGASLAAAATLAGLALLRRARGASRVNSESA